MLVRLVFETEAEEVLKLGKLLILWVDSSLGILIVVLSSSLLTSKQGGVLIGVVTFEFELLFVRGSGTSEPIVVRRSSCFFKDSVVDDGNIIKS